MMFSKTTQYQSLVGDALIATFITLSTSMLLEWIRPGFVSSVVDINALFIVLVILLAMYTFYGSIEMTRVKIWYVAFFGFFNLLLLRHFFSLQFGGHLIGLVKSTVLLALFILILYTLYDRRGKD